MISPKRSVDRLLRALKPELDSIDPARPLAGELDLAAGDVDAQHVARLVLEQPEVLAPRPQPTSRTRAPRAASPAAAMNSASPQRVFGPSKTWMTRCIQAVERSKTPSSS